MFKRILKYDYNAYLLCLLIASIFWVLNAMSSLYSTNVNYPVLVYEDSITNKKDALKTLMVMNVKGTGWEILKRTIMFQTNPVEVKWDLFKYKRKLSSSKAFALLNPTLGNLKLNYLVTDSIVISSDNFVQKKIMLHYSTEQQKMKKGFKISSKVYLEPEYVIVKGSTEVLREISDTLNFYLNAKVTSNVDTSIAVQSLFPKTVVVDEDRAHLIFDIAAYTKKTRNIKATLIDFPEKYKDLNVSFAIEYYVQNEDVNSEESAKYKIMLDYNMLNAQKGTIIPVMVDYPEYIKDLTIKPAFYKLND